LKKCQFGTKLVSKNSSTEMFCNAYSSVSDFDEDNEIRQVFFVWLRFCVKKFKEKSFKLKQKLLLGSLPFWRSKEAWNFCLAVSVTRSLEKSPIFGKIAKLVAQPKKCWKYISKPNLKVQNIYIKPLLKPKNTHNNSCFETALSIIM